MKCAKTAEFFIPASLDIFYSFLLMKSIQMYSWMSVLHHLLGECISFFFFLFFFACSVVLLLSVVGMQFDNPYNKVFWVAFHSYIYQTFPGSVVEFIFCYAIFKLTKCSILNCDLLLSLLPSCYISLWSKSNLQCIELEVDSGEKVG